jgi:hypothetical protein
MFSLSIAIRPDHEDVRSSSFILQILGYRFEFLLRVIDQWDIEEIKQIVSTNIVDEGLDASIKQLERIARMPFPDSCFEIL